MDKKSLMLVCDMLIENIYNMDINQTDKVELMINLKNFLEPKKYDDNIKILRRENARK